MKKTLIAIAAGIAVAGSIAFAYAANAANRETGAWDEPADYTYRVEYVVFGPGFGTYDITVRDHEVVAVEAVEGTMNFGDPSWVTVDNAWTLADLEAKYREAKDGSESDATITYDAATGAPSEVSLDWIVLAIDDEEYFHVVAFDPAT